MALFEPPANAPTGAPSAPPRFVPPPPPPPPSATPARNMPAAAKLAEPEDIFAGTNFGRGSGIPRNPEAVASIAESPAKGLGRKLMRLLALAIGAAIIVGGGYLGYQYFTGQALFFGSPQNANVPAANVPLNVNLPAANVPANENINFNAPAEDVNANLNANLPSTNASQNINQNANLPPVDMTTDTDNDGLTDYQETKIYFTDPNKADTDNDGLSDRDEVVTWKTGPLNPDTDGDGYKDGEEVKNGYSPLGPGKLLPPITTQ